MSSLGDLLLAHLKTNKDEKSASDSNEGESLDKSEKSRLSDNIEPETNHFDRAESRSHSSGSKERKGDSPESLSQDHFGDSVTQKIFPERVEKNKNEDTQSNASSTDDYVRELLDPDDRPKNVWHVVEGPKIQPNTDVELREASPYGDINSNLDGNSVEASVQPDNVNSPQTSADIEVPEEDIGDHKGARHDERSLERSDVRHRSRRDGSRERSSSSRRHRSTRDRDARDKEGDRGKDRDRIRGRDRGRDKIRDRDIHRSKHRHDYSDDDEGDDRRRGSRGDRRRSRSRSKTSSRRRERSRSDSQSPITKRNSRTILIMQLNPKVTSRDLEEFFSDIGKVREVRLIMDSRTRRHKGIAYIEFEYASSASKAFTLNGQKFFGAPMVIQSAQLDRNRSSSEWPPSTSQNFTHTSSISHHSSRSDLPPNSYRVYVGGLNVNLTEDMIRSVFEPFGPIIRLELMRDRVTNISRGYAFITYANIEDGQSAVEALNGFELAGKPLRVSKSTDKTERHPAADAISSSRGAHHDSDSDGRSSRAKDVTASLFELAGHR